MKLATVELPDREGPRVVVARGDAVVDLSDHFARMTDLIDAGPAGLDAAAARQAAGSLAARVEELVAWHPPLRPRQIRDFLAFEQHLVQGMRASMTRRYGRLGALLLERTGLAKVPPVWYERPLYYKGNRFAVTGHERPIRWPAYTEALDYELELAIVLGRTERDVPESRAREMVFGFTIFNDVTARDMQAAEMGPGFHLGPAKSKDFDTANVLGPWLVTADAVSDPYSLGMKARVDGQTWSSGSSSTMHWSFEEMIAYVSRSETLHAGEVFGSGTVGGGCGLEYGRFLQPGQVVELEIDGLDVLRNRIVREVPGA